MKYQLERIGVMDPPHLKYRLLDEKGNLLAEKRVTRREVLDAGPEHWWSIAEESMRRHDTMRAIRALFPDLDLDAA